METGFPRAHIQCGLGLLCRGARSAPPPAPPPVRRAVAPGTAERLAESCLHTPTSTATRSGSSTLALGLPAQGLPRPRQIECVVAGRWRSLVAGRSGRSLLHITIEYQRFSYILSLVADGVWSRVALVAHRVWSPVADGVWSLVALVADRVWPLVAVRVWSLIECGRWSLAESGRRSLWSLMESEDRVAVVAGRHGR
jgi:hypothetical protein